MAAKKASHLTPQWDGRVWWVILPSGRRLRAGTKREALENIRLYQQAQRTNGHGYKLGRRLPKREKD